MEDKIKTRLLFVCLGNICRSPAAEGVMKKVLADRGMDAHLKLTLLALAIGTRANCLIAE